MRRLFSLIAAFALAGPLPVWAQGAAAGPAASTMPPASAAEDSFVKAVEDGRATYTAGLNDMVRGVARPRRAEAICRAVPRGAVQNWTGKLVMLGSSAAGRGVVVIEVAPHLLVATNRTDAADDKDRTLIDTRSPLFAYAAALAVGDRVQFSGTLVPGTEDCFKEVGKDVKTSMADPEFVMRLDSIRKVVPPAVNAVLSGQAQPMSIAQSSDFVRDAVDVIAGGAACGVENRKVFGVIIKVLIRATAGQSTEQRDALIGLMFSPPTAASQTKENCDAKGAALDRLDAEVS